MAVKFVIVLAVIVAVMAALVAIPNIMPQPATEFIEYRRDYMPGPGEETIVDEDLLKIASDGSATFSMPSRTNFREQKFSLSAEELGRIKGLVLETGFMAIPETDYPPVDGAGNYTQYTLTVTADGEQKTIKWVSIYAYGGTIPPIILNVGAQLDDLIERKTI